MGKRHIIGIFALIYCVMCFVYFLLPDKEVEVVEEPIVLYDVSDTENIMRDLMGYKDTNLGASLAGSNSNIDKMNEIATVLEDKGLQVSNIPVIMDTWELSDFNVQFACDCAESGILSLYKVGVYPFDFVYEETELKLYKNSAYSYMDDLDGGILLSSLSPSSYNSALEHGADFIIYNSGIDTYTDFSVDTSIVPSVPMFSISATNYSVMKDNIDTVEALSDGSSAPYFTMTVTGSSSLKKDTEVFFVEGKIEGNSEEEIMVILNSDSLYTSYMGTDYDIAEMYKLIDSLQGYEFEKTVTFLITTGTVWNSIEKGNDFSTYLTEYLSGRDISSVLILDGSKPVNYMGVASLGYTSELSDIVNEYNSSVVDENFYTILTPVDSYTSDEVKATLSLGIPTIAKIEPPSTYYSTIKGTTEDDSENMVSLYMMEYLIDYYSGLIKVLDSK